MSYFSLKANCSFCGKKLDLITIRGRIELKNGWICSDCLKKTKGRISLLQFRKMSVDEIGEILLDETNKEKNLHDIENSQLVEIIKISKLQEINESRLIQFYKVDYLGGIPGYKAFNKLFIEFYDKALRLTAKKKESDFIPLNIPYRVVSNIKISYVKKKSFSKYIDMREIPNLHITLCYENNEYVLRLALVDDESISKKDEKYRQFLDFLKMSGIENQFYKSSDELHVTDDILKYKQLLDIGAITQDEYDQKKKELLNL